MPNPLLRMGRMNTSKVPNERPEPVAPTEEQHYTGEVNPYRGIENHGVAAKQTPYEDYWDEEGRPVVIYAPEPNHMDPVPVRLVTSESSGREYREWRTDRRNVNGTPQQLLGRDDQRKNFRLINMDAAKTIYVGPNADDLAILGYPLGPGKDMTSTAESPLYAVTSDGSNGVQIGLLVEFAVND